MPPQTTARLNTAAIGVSDDGNMLGRSLPGETVEFGPKGLRIIEPSLDRVSPPCRHFKSCGGCALQHASDEFVANWKSNVIRTGLAARGIETDIRPIKTSPAQSRRRAALHGKRTKSGAMIGFHARGSDLLIETPDCQLLAPEIMASFRLLEQITVLTASRKGEVTFTVTTSLNGLDIDITGCKPLEASTIMQLSALAEAAGLARLAWEGDVIALRAPAAQIFGPANVTPPPGAFLQATAHGEASLNTAVTEALDGCSAVIDLFAGCGTFTFPAARNAPVWALEGEATLIAALEASWREAQGLKAITAQTRDLFRNPVHHSEMRKFDAVIIDPPRAGAEAQTHEIAASGVARVAAVSCNPVSFARDAEILINAGFTLDWVQPVDQFRWSAHVELAAQFTRPHIATA